MRRSLLALATVVLAGAGIFAAPAISGASSSSTAVFPTVSTKWGVQPKISFPTKTAPTALEQEVIHHGSGPKVQKKDLLIANYVAQIWDGKVFDNSWTSDPGAFPIGVGLVIKGWDDELVNDHIGDRVVLVVPPADGYGSAGQSSAGITGKDVLVFVVDLESQYSLSSVHADARATKEHSAVGGVSVTGKLSGPPTISIAKGTAKPSTEKVTVLDRGNGKKINAGIVVMQLLYVNWSGQLQGSTWASGSPAGQPVGEKNAPSIFDDLSGVPLGSRVLITLPESSGDGPYALVADLGAEPYHGTGQ